MKRAICLSILLVVSARLAVADCSGVSGPPATGLSTAGFGPVTVTQAFLPDGVTPVPLAIDDCMGDSPFDLVISWSGPDASPPAAFHFDTACPDGAEGVIITASGSAGPSEWSAYDGAGSLLDSETVPAGGPVTFSLNGPKIKNVTVKGAEICVEQVCWLCTPSATTITFDPELAGTLITNQFEPLGVVFDDVRSPVRIVNAEKPGTSSGTQALEVVYRGDPPSHAGPMKFRFTQPMKRVLVRVGQHFGRQEAQSEAVLRAFDAKDKLIARSYVSIGAGPGPIREPLEVNVTENAIQRVEVQFLRRDLVGNLKVEVDTSGVETLDDLTFDADELPPPPKDALPVVHITSPEDGRVVFGAAEVLIEGTVVEDKGLTKLTLRHEYLEEDPDPKPLSLDWSGVAPKFSFPGSAGSVHMELHPGRNRLTIEAEDTNGQVQDDAVDVILARPPRVIIDSPARGTKVAEGEVSVSGHIDVEHGTLLKEKVLISVDAEDPRGKDWPSIDLQTFQSTGSGYSFSSSVPIDTRAVGNKSIITVQAAIEEGLVSITDVEVEWSVVQDVRAVAIEVTQATLSPTLVGGKETVARVYPIVIGYPSWPPLIENAQLFGHRDGIPLPGSPLEEEAFVFSDATSYSDRQNNQNLTWNFALPASWRIPGVISLTAVIDPDGSLGECPACLANNEVETEVTFQEGETLRIQPVSIRYRYDGDWSTQPTEDDVASAFEAVKRTYPAAEVEINWPPLHDSYRVNFTVDAGQTSEQQRDELIDDMNELLGRFSDEYTCTDANFTFPGSLFLSGTPCTWSTYYVGVIPPVPGFCTAGLSHLEFPACVAFPDPWTVAHELGHCVGRMHSSDDHGELGDSDPDFPYDHGRIGIVGFDTTARVAIPTEEPYPAGSPDLANSCVGCDPLTGDCHSHDFMSYGMGPIWISDHTWEAIFAHGFSGPAEAGAGGGETAGEAAMAPEIVQLRGRVKMDGTVLLRPFYTAEVPPDFQLQAQKGPLEARAVDASGGVLSRRALRSRATSDAAGSMSFSDLLPFPPGAAAIEVYQAGELRAARAVSPNPPEVSLLSPNGGESLGAGGEIEISWEASDPDGDALQYAVQYSSSGGDTWVNLGLDVEETSLLVHVAELRGGTRCLIRVIATDGVRSAWDGSDAFFSVADKPPHPFILSPRKGTRIKAGHFVTLEGTATDLEDGGLRGDALVWRSDIDGLLGKGRQLDAFHLSEGLHRITLEAADSSGARASAEVELAVGEVAPPPGEARFIRADVNADGLVNISDPIALLSYLFSGGTAPRCEDAADSNDDGRRDISDASYTLAFLFLGGPAPRAPFPEPGVDPTADDLTCDATVR